MRTINSLFRYFVILIFSGLVIAVFTSCEKPAVDELDFQESVLNEDEIPWQDLLTQLDLESNILFVQAGESIQDVVDSAKPGDVIYVEPGNYQESVSIKNQDIKVVGLSLEPDDLMIEYAEKNNIEIIKLYEDGDYLQNRSLNRPGKNILRLMKRTSLGNGIAHYQFEIVMGPGEFNVIRLHRVVRERRPYRPVYTRGNVFMVHGAIQDFDDIFLTAGAETINAETSSPFYLASNNIDVWGIDMGWTMVPLQNRDFSFMEGWGMEKDISHTLTAMSLARLIRGLTYQGFSRMNLLGFSYGVHVAYGAANRETQQHRFWRDVKGIIPVDSALKYEDENAMANSCAAAAFHMDHINIGLYNHPWGVDFIKWGKLALKAPDGKSPDFPGTNSQFLMFVGSQGFFAADENGAYLYSDPLRFFRLAVNLSPHWPRQLVYELTASSCPKEDVTYDDHLGEISIPILYIGAEMAEGSAGIYTSSLTASTDITNYIVPGYSHADLWFAYDADEMVWSPLCNWLKNHK
ncbi:MAG: hypothetical protein HKO81_05570 [Flavobacteriaceae bacterium]|nr:hypothetical protein [Bacteroidia bacterium]NNL16093.1 hypothetical protein [Flavobacteriaceae bacterium]